MSRQAQNEGAFGLVKFRLRAAGKWEFRWWDPRERKRTRRLAPAANFTEAETRAREYNQAVCAEKGFEDSLPKWRDSRLGLSVKDAIAEAIRNSRAGAMTRADYLHRGNSFLKWLENSKPAVRLWGDLNEAILQDYVRHCESGKLAHDSIRLRVFVVKMASKYLSRIYPKEYGDVGAAITARERKGPAKARSVLSAAQLRSLLAYAKEKRADLHPILALQGLAGFREFEAAFVTEADIDFKAGTVAVSENPRHVPKTRASFRRLPVCEEVMGAMREAIGRLRVRGTAGADFLFPSPRGGAPWSADGIRHALGDLVSDWVDAQEEKSRPVGFVPRQLRHTFVTLCRERGSDARVLARYVGHSGADMMALHYEQVSADRLKAEVADRIAAVMADAEAQEKAEAEKRTGAKVAMRA